MNKTTEALKLAAKALSGDYAVHPDEALAAIREALAEPVCEHRIADARNKYIKDGYICIKCGALFRAADHAEPVKQEPVNQKAVGCYYGAADHIGHVVRIDVEIPIGTLLYAAPVDAASIRSEALEDAVKFLEENGMIAPNGFTADGIRGLK